MDKALIPTVSVLMPVYNCKDYIRASVESILQQTFKDFELLIIDDASTDGTYELVRGIEDPRIRLIRKPVQSGYTDSLNMGIELATGKFIARMDGDDISLPERFEKQVAFLVRNPSVGICGSNYIFLGTNQVTTLPTNPEDLSIRLLSQSPLAHPTVMMRKEIFEKTTLRYETTCQPAEDYNLWVDIARHTLIANVEIPLLYYRVHANQISVYKSQLQLEKADKARLKALRNILPNCSEREKKLHLALVKSDVSSGFLPTEIKGWGENLRRINDHDHFFQVEKFCRFVIQLEALYLKNYLAKHNKGVKGFFKMLNPKTKYYRLFSNRELLKLWIPGFFLNEAG